MLDAAIPRETPPAAGRAGSRAALRSRGSARGRQGWRAASPAPRRAGDGRAQRTLRDRARLQPAPRPHRRAARAWSPPRSPSSTATSSLFEASPTILNPALGGAGRDFANAVALIASALAPPEMLAALKAIERDFGRRGGRRWGPRVLDLDIIVWMRRALARPRPDRPPPANCAARLRARPARRGRARLAARSAALTVRQLAHRLARRAPRRLTDAQSSRAGPLAQSVEQLTFNQ